MNVIVLMDGQKRMHATALEDIIIIITRQPEVRSAMVFWQDGSKAGLLLEAKRASLASREDKERAPPRQVCGKFDSNTV